MKILLCTMLIAATRASAAENLHQSMERLNNRGLDEYHSGNFASAEADFLDALRPHQQGQPGQYGTSRESGRGVSIASSVQRGRGELSGSLG